MTILEATVDAGIAAPVAPPAVDGSERISSRVCLFADAVETARTDILSMEAERLRARVDGKTADRCVAQRLYYITYEVVTGLPFSWGGEAA